MIKGITVIEISPDGITNNFGHQTFDSFASITKTLDIDHEEYLALKTWWERAKVGRSMYTAKGHLLIVTNEPEVLTFLNSIKEWSDIETVMVLLAVNLGFIEPQRHKDITCHQSPVYNLLWRFIDDLFMIRVLQRDTRKGWNYRLNPKFSLDNYEHADMFGCEGDVETRE